MERVTKCYPAADKLSRKRCENWTWLRWSYWIQWSDWGKSLANMSLRQNGRRSRVRTDNSFKEYFFKGK